MADNNRYFIYGRSSCSFCAAAINYCSAMSRPYFFFDYELEKEELDKVKEFYSSETVPIVLANDLETGFTKKVGGYTDLLDFLDSKI